MIGKRKMIKMKDMKKYGFYASALMTILGLSGLVSCDDTADFSDESVVAKVFMTQTSVNGGMVYNEYSVPLEGDPDARHHVIDAQTNTLRVILGVRQSGGSADAFSVSVSADRSYSESMLSAIPNAVLLPEGTYSLPSDVRVKEGDKEAVFYLDVDLDKLAEEYSDYFNRKLVVTVHVSEPTRFEMNKARSRTVVIIDGRTFIPQSIQISMPQASMLNGGVTNHYPVPFDAQTENYTFDPLTGRLTVPLGVSRNGEEPFDSFSVSVGADISHASGQLGSIEDGLLLPEDTYSLPSEVVVREGQTGASFDLVVDVAKLVADYAGYARNKLVLTVRISEPTLYELEPGLSQTVVVVDAAKFYPKPEAPNLVQGGAFNPGDEVHWTAVNSDGGGGKGQGLKPQMASVRDGALTFTITGRCYHTFYQKVTLTEEELGQYKMSIRYKNAGSPDAGGRVYAAFATKPPVTDETYPHQNYIAARVEGTIRNAFDDEFLGTFSQKYNGLDHEGRFTVTTAGDYYLVLGVDMWSGSLNASFDDVKLQRMDE